MTQRTNGETHSLREDRIKELLEQESKNPLGWWYLSYADEQGFRGGLIIEARGFASAVMLANIIGASPGGEVQGLPIPEEHVPPESHRNRLLTLAELESVWGTMSKLSELESEE